MGIKLNLFGNTIDLHIGPKQTGINVSNHDGETTVSSGYNVNQIGRAHV